MNRFTSLSSLFLSSSSSLLLLLSWQEGVTYLTAQDLLNPPCVNWEETAAAYNAAWALWKEPSCYNFTVGLPGSLVSGPTLDVRTVINGQVALLDETNPLRTLNDFWSLIFQMCIENCPESGAYLCSNTYSEITTPLGDTISFPSAIDINERRTIIGDERIYAISDFVVIDCDSRESLSAAPASGGTAPTSAPNGGGGAVVDTPTMAPAIGDPVGEQPSDEPTLGTTQIPTVSPAPTISDPPSAVPTISTGDLSVRLDNFIVRVSSMEVGFAGRINRPAIAGIFQDWIRADFLTKFPTFQNVKVELFAQQLLSPRALLMEYTGNAYFVDSPPSQPDVVAEQKLLFNENASQIQELFDTHPTLGVGNITLESLVIVSGNSPAVPLNRGTSGSRSHNLSWQSILVHGSVTVLLPLVVVVPLCG